MWCRNRWVCGHAVSTTAICGWAKQRRRGTYGRDEPEDSKVQVASERDLLIDSDDDAFVHKDR